jgi:uroporphyrinogen III methyltransferase/synthase
VYDNLMADEFVALSGASEKIFVGKSSGRHALAQEDINALLVEKAREGKRVVRLKGGDPFVFGRGGEECHALTEAGMPFKVIPGVTAAIAGTAYAGIPVTHRELSRGVTLVTAHFAKDHSVDLPWQALAGLDHTLVFYMGVASIDRISDELIAHGLSGETPAAVLERATTGSQREVIGVLSDIAQKTAAAGVRPPGILVVGRVVNLHTELAWLPPRPLAGKGVIFTRAAESQYAVVQRLRDLGAEVLDVPIVRAQSRGLDEDVREALVHLNEFAAIAFTSALAVEIFFADLHEAGLDVRTLANHKLAAGSKSVLKALKSRGVVADLTPGRTGGGQLAEAIAASGLAPGSRILMPRSSAADSVLPDSLKAAGFEPTPLPIYDSVPVGLDWIDVKLANWHPDAVVFLSGTGIEALHAAAPQLFNRENQPIWACVGEKTADNLRAFDIEASLVPKTPDVDLLVDSLIARLSGLNHSFSE